MNRPTFPTSTFLVFMMFPTCICFADESATSSARNSTEKKVLMSFRSAPWEDVLDELADAADLTFSLDVIPTGTFNYVDDREFTVNEAIDLANSYLLVKGYTLLRKGKMLLVLDLEETTDRQLIRDLLTFTPSEDLTGRGEYEITKTRFFLEKADAKEVEEQIRVLLSPVGSLNVLPKAKQIIATETGGTLRTMQGIIDSLEVTADKEEAGKLHAFSLQEASADEVLVVAKPLLSIEEDENAAEDGSIRISADPLGRTIFATGTPDKISLVQQIVKQVDEKAGIDKSSGTVESPQFMSHPTTADPDAVLRVLQTLFVGDPLLRLEIDRSTGRIMAMARLAQHRQITATIAEMERNPERFAVIPLYKTTPAAAAILVKNLFSNSQSPPLIDGTADPPQLVVRGTQTQILQIQSLLNDLGETDSPRRSGYGGRGNVRTISMSPEMVQFAVEMIQQSWPEGKNRIRVIELDRAPKIETLRGNPSGNNENPNAEQSPEDSDGAQPSDNRAPKSLPDDDDITYRTMPIAQLEDENDEADVAETQGKTSVPDIVITQTQDGVMLMSQDRDALDRLQALFESIADQASPKRPGFHMAYLQHVEAETAKTLLTDILSGVTSAAVPIQSGDSSIGGNIGSIIQAGPTAASSNVPHMVADNRLNALVIHGTPQQVANVKQLLEVIDSESGPAEVLTFPKPQFIPVIHTSAESVAEVVREVYANRIETGESNNNNRDRGRGDDRGGFSGRFGGFFGRGGDDRGRDRGGRDRGRSQQQSSTDLPKMTLGVDTENNALVVSAPGRLFSEVEAMVQEIDRRSAQKGPETYSIVTLEQTNIDNIKQALSVFGDQVTFSESTSSDRGNNRSSSRSSGRSSSNTGGRPSFGGFPGGFPFSGFRGGFDRGGSSRDGSTRGFGDRGGSTRGDRGGSTRGGGDRGGSRRGGR